MLYYAWLAGALRRIRSASQSSGSSRPAPPRGGDSRYKS